jgi:uncharacterized protein (TIGR00369 family)
MAPDIDSLRSRLRTVNDQSPFNRWAGFEIIQVGEGTAELALTVRPELRQHTGSLHAGVTGALIDTVCGFAAVTVVGAAVVASQYQVAFYAPTTGDRFLARARVAKAGKRQIFVNAEMFDITSDSHRLVAGGTAVLLAVVS